MITFFRLKVSGFKSISELDISLNTQNITIIRGANGFGKSSILDSLAWCIFGKSIKGVSEVQTLPKFWDNKNPYTGVKVEVYFQSDNEIYRVIRCQGYKLKLEDGLIGGNRLVIARDGCVINIKGKPKLQEFLEDKLGMSYTLFVNSILFGQGLKRLIQETNTDKKKIFEEAFNLQFITKAKDIASKDYKKYKDDYREYKLVKNQLEEDIDNLQGIYDKQSKDKTEYENSLKEQISTLNDRYKFKYKEYNKLSKELEQIVNPTDDISELNKKISSIKSDIYKCKEKTNVPLVDFVKSMYKLLTKGKYKELGKNLKSLYTIIKKVESLEKDIDSLNDKLRDKQKQKDAYQKLKWSVNNLSSDIEHIKDKIDTLKRSKKDTHKVSNTSDIRKQIKNKKAKLGELINDNSELEGIIQNYEWVLNDPLSNSGIKAYLFDSCLEKLNSVLDSFSGLLGFRIIFFIDLNTVRKDFDTIIEKDGEKLLYEELSGGEKQLVNVAIAFAMNIALTESRGLNLMFLDEVFESLDKDNIELVINLIENIFQNKTLFIISHQDSLPIHNSKVLQVEKIQGLSYYKVL